MTLPALKLHGFWRFAPHAAMALVHGAQRTVASNEQVVRAHAHATRHGPWTQKKIARGETRHTSNSAITRSVKMSQAAISVVRPAPATLVKHPGIWLPNA